MTLQAGHELRGTRTPTPTRSRVPSGQFRQPGRRPFGERPTLAELYGDPLSFTLDRHGLPRDDLPCLDADPETFFPVGTSGVGGRDELEDKVELARSFCARCPVRDGCLRWALDHDPNGIWGGTTEAERYELTGRWPRNSTRANRQGATT